jgi:hypothetical protein
MGINYQTKEFCFQIMSKWTKPLEKCTKVSQKCTKPIKECTKPTKIWPKRCLSPRKGQWNRHITANCPRGVDKMVICPRAVTGTTFYTHTPHHTNHSIQSIYSAGILRGRRGGVCFFPLMCSGSSHSRRLVLISCIASAVFSDGGRPFCSFDGFSD